jgi:hypothetical protein
VPFKTGLAPPLCLSACNEPGKVVIMYLFAKGVDLSFFYGFGNRFWYCSYSVVLFVHEPTFNPGSKNWCSGRVLVPAPLVAPVVLI